MKARTEMWEEGERSKFRRDGVEGGSGHELAWERG